ncbi:hypothetical protein [Azoarcus sp. DD4]|uniref:hypothetical protein n=1 Tax=Azoarcus sp. DD4 TaxID=2027405 RepID=UPI00143D566B|nr:hypothetical protein [Azoarcus sp. DD4]
MDVEYLECELEVIELDGFDAPEPDAAASAEAIFMAWFTDLRGRCDSDAGVVRD